MANEKRLIDASALIAEYDRVHIGPPGGARKLMEDAPTVDAVEVVHGRWEEHPRDTFARENHCEKIRCTHCWHFFYRHYGDGKNYCPNCGAKMDGDGNG